MFVANKPLVSARVGVGRESNKIENGAVVEDNLLPISKMAKVCFNLLLVLHESLKTYDNIHARWGP